MYVHYCLVTLYHIFLPVQFKVAGFVTVDDFYSCNDPAYQNCSGLATSIQKEVSSCCGICDGMYGTQYSCMSTHTYIHVHTYDFIL